MGSWLTANAMFDIWYCPRYPLARINYSTRIYKPDMENFRLALAENIKEQGLVNPLIILNHRDPTKYKPRWLKTGNNRLWALQYLGYTEAPAIVTGTCEEAPAIKVSFEYAQSLIKDGKLVYAEEAHGAVLQLEDVTKPDEYNYPVGN